MRTNKRKKLQVDISKLEQTPYKNLSAIGKELADVFADISYGKRDSVGKRIPTELTEGQKAKFDLVREAFKELTIQQKHVLNLTFGLNGEQPHTEREIAKKLSISQQGTHDLKKRALNAIKRKIELNEVAIKEISEK